MEPSLRWGQPRCYVYRLHALIQRRASHLERPKEKWSYQIIFDRCFVGRFGLFGHWHSSWDKWWAHLVYLAFKESKSSWSCYCDDTSRSLTCWCAKRNKLLQKNQNKSFRSNWKYEWVRMPRMQVRKPNISTSYWWCSKNVLGYGSSFACLGTTWAKIANLKRKR